MALKNGNDNYLKITNVRGNLVNDNKYGISYVIYENESARQNPTDFTNMKRGNVKSDNTIFGDIQDQAKSIKDNILTKAYLYLKSNGFSDWTDC